VIRATRFLGFGGPVVVAALILNAVAAHAFAPYTTGQTGYDVSYPQCPGTSAPAGSFGIIGVNGGRPFSPNSCFDNEYAAAPPTASVYINTGYAKAYRSRITAGCAAGGTQAWAIGCSEAEYSLKQVGGRTPSMWWLDVETDNSWSSTDLSLNQFTIQGIVDTLHQATSAVGIYSTGYQWQTIVGSLPVTGVRANWVATGNLAAEGAHAVCGTGFSGAPVWLVQYIQGGFDANYAC